MTLRQFHEADGVDDWRVVANGACAYFRTGSFTAGVELVDAIGEMAEAANHHPDVDLRYGGVTVRLTTHDVQGLSEHDVALARRISLAARELDIPAEPAAVQQVDLTIDALVGPDVLPFWRAVLGYRQEGDEDVLDPHGRGPSIWFEAMDQPRPQRNRLHIDVWFRTTGPRPGSRRRSRPAATSSATSTRRPGGPWPTARATRSTWRPGGAATRRAQSSWRPGIGQLPGAA